MLPYARPTITEDEIREVEECLRSGWLATGPRTQRFEEALAAFSGARCCVATNTGTAALHLALLAAGVRPGDEVITTPMTWVATANVVLHCGARPVFVDVEPGTLNIDPTRIETAITDKTRAVMPVHYAGLPCDEDALLEICRARDLALVEDAAHALGASYKGRPIGSIGDVTMFSFHPAKNLTTGEGGAIVCDDPELAARAKRLRYHGIDMSPESRFGGRGPAAYDVVEAGFKYNISDLQSAIGLHQLAHLAERNRRRADLAAAYRAALPTVPHVEPLRDAPYEYEHAWHMMVVRANTGALTLDRDGLVQALREREIGAGVHFVPLHLQTLYREAASGADLPVATEAHEQILTLPLFPDMRDEDVGLVVDVLRDVVDSHTRAS